MTGNSRWFIGYPGITMSSSWIRIDHHIDYHIDNNHIITSSYHHIIIISSYHHIIISSSYHHLITSSHHHIIISSPYHYHSTMIGSSCHRIYGIQLQLQSNWTAVRQCTKPPSGRRGRLGHGSRYLAFSQPKQGSKHRFLGWIEIRSEIILK